jgi:acyl carrier protein
MSQVDERLLRCFSSVFPGLSEQDILAADITRLVEADSLAGVTLVALIDDEFGVDLDLEGLLELRTFGLVRRHLHG